MSRRRRTWRNCDKLRVGVQQPLIRRFPNGETQRDSTSRYYAASQRGAYPLKWNISVSGGKENKASASHKFTKPTLNKTLNWHQLFGSVSWSRRRWQSFGFILWSRAEQWQYSLSSGERKGNSLNLPKFLWNLSRGCKADMFKSLLLTKDYQSMIWLIENSWKGLPKRVKAS